MPVLDLSPQLLAVRDQGTRGTCVAFAVTAAHEHARLSRGAGALLGVEMLFWGCKQADADPDDGTTFAAASTALAADAQSTEALWPYDTTRDHRSSAYRPPAAALQPSERRRATLAPITATLPGIAEQLHAGHLIVVGLELWDAFYACSSSTIQPPDADFDGGGHAVCLVGMDEDARRVKVRNSWGTSWGDGGCAWLSFAGLASALLDAWVVRDDLDPA